MEDLQPTPSPNISKETAYALVYRLYGIKNVNIVKLNGYYDKNYHIQVNSNNNEEKLWPHGYVLKIINSTDSQNPSAIEAQIEITLYLGKNGIKCPQPVKTLKGRYYSEEYLPLEDLCKGANNCKHLVYMLTYQPGRLLKEIPCTKQILYNVGKLIAKVDDIFKGFHHPGYDSNYQSSFSLLYISQFRNYLSVVEKKDKRDLISDVITTFEMDVSPIADSLEKGLLHYDIHEQNILMSETDNGCWDFCALLDFGDVHRSCYVFELAISICHMILFTSDPLSVAGYVIAGYSTVRTLPEEEFNILKVCVCARLCQLLLFGMYTHTKDPGNNYLLDWIKNGAWEILDFLWKIPQDELNDKWKSFIVSYDKE